MLNEDILQGCLNGERKCQEQLYRQYASLMYAVCKSYASDNDSAKEMLQTGFIKVFKNISLYKKDGELGAWIRRIMVNNALDHCRKLGRLRSVSLDDITYEAEEHSPIMNDMNFSDLLSFVRELPEKAKIVFNLYAVEGYSHKEIAEKLNITEGTSKSQYSRAKQLLQDKLKFHYNAG